MIISNRFLSARRGWLQLFGGLRLFRCGWLPLAAGYRCSASSGGSRAARARWLGFRGRLPLLASYYRGWLPLLGELRGSSGGLQGQPCNAGSCEQVQTWQTDGRNNAKILDDCTHTP